MITLVLTGLFRGVRTQRALVLENLALRHLLTVFRRSTPRPRLRPSGRLFQVLLSRLWHGWAEVPTVLFKVLFVFVVLAHDRRRVVHVNVTDTPTAQWTAQQLVEAFPWDTAPRYLLRDRDAVYGAVFSSQVRSLGIHEVEIAPRSPWQNPYIERLIGTLRRECLDHTVVLNDAHLRRLLRDYLLYYHSARTHLALAIETPLVGSLHHHYTRRAA